VSCQVVLKPSNGIPADYVTNTWHFAVQYTEVDGVGPNTRFDACDQAHDALVTFYNTLSTRFGGLLIGTHEMKFVDLGEPAPRLPVAEFVWAFTTVPPASQLPSEVAIVASFEGSLQSGVNPATRKNRVFLGPLAQSTVNPTGGTLSAGAQTAVINALVALAVASAGASAVWWWVGRSPTMNNTFIVRSGWVDNAFDTQRRRGIDATNRGIWVQDAEPS